MVVQSLQSPITLPSKTTSGCSQFSKVSEQILSEVGELFQTNLEAATCSCKRYQDTLSSCGHAIIVIRRLQRAPIEYIPVYAKQATWIASYTHNFPSIDLSDVELVYSRGRVFGGEAGNEDSDPYSGSSEPRVTGLAASRTLGACRGTGSAAGYSPPR